MLAFVVPLWVLPFLPPWPVVFVALFAATFFTPLINGPIIAVLTARTPEGLRAMVMTSVISINTLAAPLGFLVAAQVLEHWESCRRSPGSSRGRPGWRSSCRDRPSSTRGRRRRRRRGGIASSAGSSRA
jgi:hypothetical protein